MNADRMRIWVNLRFIYVIKCVEKKTEARLDSCQTLYKRVTQVNSVKFEFWKSSGNGGVTYPQKMKSKQHNIKYGNQNTIHMNRYNSDTIIYFYGYIHILYAPIIKKNNTKTS